MNKYLPKCKTLIIFVQEIKPILFYPMNKSNEYAKKILLQIQEMFKEDCDNFIDLDEFEEADNATAFIHALGVTAPNLIYQQLTGDKTDNLGFTHICNRLCVQFQNKRNEDAEL